MGLPDVIKMNKEIVTSSGLSNSNANRLAVLSKIVLKRGDFIFVVMNESNSSCSMISMASSFWLWGNFIFSDILLFLHVLIKCFLSLLFILSVTMISCGLIFVIVRSVCVCDMGPIFLKMGLMYVTLYSIALIGKRLFYQIEGFL